jgi:hypothetical protein
MAVYDLPSRLRARRIAFDDRGMAVAGPPSMTDRTMINSLDAGYWVADLELATLSPGEDVKVFRQLRALLEGGANQLRVPVFDGGRAGGQAPWAYDGGTPITAVSNVTFSDGALFADGTEFYQQPITVELTAPAALRAIEIAVEVSQAGEIMGGEYFSLGDRLHVIRQVLAVESTTQTWRVWPPLREAHAAGEQLNFARPVCRMTLTSPASLTLGRLWMASPTLSFIEAAP